MNSPQEAGDRLGLLHRLLYRLGQGALAYWIFTALFAPAAELPSRSDLVVSAALALLMLALPRPHTPATTRPARGGWQRMLTRPLQFLA